MPRHSMLRLDLIGLGVLVLGLAALSACRARPDEAAPHQTREVEAPPRPTAAARRLAPPLVHSPDIRLSGTSQDPERIACGSGSCDPSASYCEVVQSDVLELPSDFTCRPLPRACSPSSDCTCFPRGTRCSDFCSRADTGGFRLTCVGGR